MANYINNKTFYAELVKYRAKIAECKADGKPVPPIPNYIGECITKIAKRLAHKPNFIGYSHKEEMEADGIENCIKYLQVFDPNKSQNPFAYFTQTIKNAFIRRIKTEKKQFYLKCKATQISHLTSQLHDNTFIPEDNEVVNSFIKEYEASLLKKKLEAQEATKVIKNGQKK